MSDTTVSVLTPPGKSALAVLSIAGPRAWDVGRRMFAPRRDDLPDAPEAGQFWLGRVGDDVRDDAVLAAREGGVELHVHGGREVLRWLLELLRQRGIPEVPWQTRDAPTADVLSRTATLRTASLALAQHLGEDVSRWGQALTHLAEPWRVVIAGAPNAGKSSLMNALAGYQRSIVSPTPGTTRDVVTLALAIDGWPVEFADVAGLREAGEALEGQGIELAREAMRAADLCVWVIDPTGTPVLPPAGMDRVLVVVNKIDLGAARDVEGVRVSALTGEGLQELCEAIGARLVS